MIGLTFDEHTHLMCLARRGELPLGRDGLPLSCAIRLQMAGAAKIVGDPQRVVITPEGRVLARRTAA